jgi:hypothetical protein
MDARVDDVAARDMNRARDPIEEPRMIGGVDADQRGAAIRIDLRVDR